MGVVVVGAGMGVTVTADGIATPGVVAVALVAAPHEDDVAHILALTPALQHPIERRGEGHHILAPDRGPTRTPGTERTSRDQRRNRNLTLAHPLRRGGTLLALLPRSEKSILHLLGSLLLGLLPQVTTTG